MGYTNPTPTVDKARRFVVNPTFTFEDAVTLEEAAAGINKLIQENGGQLPLSWVGYADHATINRDIQRRPVEAYDGHDEKDGPNY